MPFDRFEDRHIGPDAAERDAMLKVIGASSLDALIDVLQHLRDDLPLGDRLAEVFADANRYRLLLRGHGH